MNCPRCHSALAAKTYEADVEVNECPDCHGLWLDAGELDRIQEAVASDSAPSLERPENTVQRSFEMARQRAQAEIDCPRCGVAMGRREAHYASGVLVDVCPQCAGYWLDRSELQTLEAFSERMRIEERRERQRGFFASFRQLLGE